MYIKQSKRIVTEEEKDLVKKQVRKIAGVVKNT